MCINKRNMNEIDYDDMEEMTIEQVNDNRSIPHKSYISL